MTSVDKTQKNERLSHRQGLNLLLGQVADSLFDSIPFGVLTFDPQLRITDANPLARKMLAPADNLKDALDAGLTPEQALPCRERLAHALADGNPCTCENLAYSLNGRNTLLRFICTPLPDEGNQEVIGGILLIEDVTARRVMENDLADAERLAAVGKLAARVAHELNNPLDGILRYLNLALRLADQQQLDKIAQYLGESRKGLMRMVHIVSDLLEFSRSTYNAFQEADVNKILEDAVKAMESLADDTRVEITRHYGRDLPNIRSGNLFQVFSNLIKNAIDAMSNGGQLELTTTCNRHHLLIEFADTGTGLSAETNKKLFEPFFTTKAPGKGTGLGLAICRDIVERYDGQIKAQNRPQGGALFTVTIPLERTSRGANP